MIDSSRRTPLYYAVEKGYTKIVQTLLEYDTYMEVLYDVERKTRDLML